MFPPKPSVSLAETTGKLALTVDIGYGLAMAEVCCKRLPIPWGMATAAAAEYPATTARWLAAAAAIPGTVTPRIAAVVGIDVATGY